MGECIFTRREAKIKKLPVLNGSYPANATVWHGNQATFKVAISEAGVPDEYTYQWYRNGSVWTGATNASVSWSSAAIGSHTIYCIVTNKAGSVRSRTATLTVKDPAMYYTYTGTAEKIDDGNGNWRIKLKTSGTLKFTAFGNWNGKVDVFCVGGGGAAGWGWYNGYYGKGACGGFTATKKSVATAVNTAYTCTIGAGGQESWATGGTTSALNGALTAAGGGKLTGGSGGGAYGNNVPYDGGSDGGNGATASGNEGNAGIDHGGAPGKGQGTTTREFGESSGTLYAGGGGSGTSNSSRRSAGGAGGGGAGAWSVGSVPQEDGAVNTGGGGGGCWYGVGSKVGAGGSGIIVIRNHR